MRRNIFDSPSPNRTLFSDPMGSISPSPGRRLPASVSPQESRSPGGRLPASVSRQPPSFRQATSSQSHTATTVDVVEADRSARVEFVLNGNDIALDGVDLLAPLANTIREHAGLTGTKVACGQGNCGACTVAIEYPDHNPEGPPIVVNSCLFPTGGLVVPDGKVKVITVEGVANPGADPARQRANKAGKAIAECNGSQCGFCTPGMVMKAAFHAMNPKAPTDVEDIEDLLDGNLCRCTGYRPILYALKTEFAETSGTRSDDPQKNDYVDPRVTEEVEETPDNVVRGGGAYGNYSKTYASGGLKHKNVMYPAPPPDPSADGGRSANVLENTRDGHRRTTLRRTDDKSPARRLMAAPAADASERLPTKVKVTGTHPRTSRGSREVTSSARLSQLALGSIRSRSALRPPPTLGSFKPPQDARRAASHSPSRLLKSGSAEPAKKTSTTLAAGAWEAPQTFREVLQILQTYGPRAQLVAGNVSSAWTRLFNSPTDTVFVSINHVTDLRVAPIVFPTKNPSASFTPLMTLSEFLAFFEGLDQSIYAVQSVIEHIKTIANIQVRNLGTIGGNIIAAQKRGGILHSDIGLIFATMKGWIHIAMLDHSGHVQDHAISVHDFLTLPDGGVPASYKDKWSCSGLTIDLPTKKNNDVVRFARTSCRAYGNFPTLCSTGYQNFGNSSTIASIFFTGPHWTDHAKLALVQGQFNVASPLDPKGSMQSVSDAVRAQYSGVSDADQRLIVQMSARVLGIDGTPEGEMAPSQSSQRRAEGQQGKQVFYVDPVQSPVTEPMIKEAAYEHYTGKALYAQDTQPPRGALNGSPVTMPSAIVEFDPVALQQMMLQIFSDPGVYSGQQNLVSVLTAADVPYNKETDEWMVVPNIYSPARDMMFTRRNVLIDDHTYGTKNKLTSDENKLQPGSFGEFVLAPGFTTFAGQPIALVLHPDETMSRHLAFTVQDRLNNFFDPSNPMYHNVAVFGTPGINPNLKDRTADLAVQNIEMSRQSKKLLNNPNLPTDSGVQQYGYPQVHARGQKSTFTTPAAYDSTKPFGPETTAYSSMWETWKANPLVTVVECSDKTNPVIANRQAHMYMETQTAICRREEDRFYVTAATQNCADVQSRLSALLNVAPRDVVVSNHRVGGGFGGKTLQSANIAALAALGNVATGHPVRVALDRQVDFDIIGKRHEFHGRYRVAIDTKTQKFLGMELIYDGDAGCSSDCSIHVLERANISSENMYDIPEFRSSAYCWLTHKQTGTAMRSFGVVQGATITEAAVDHAHNQLMLDRERLGIGPTLDAQEFRFHNFYTKFVPTAPGQTPPNYDPTMWTDNKVYPNPAVYYPKTPMCLTYDNAKRQLTFALSYGQELLETDNMDHATTGAWKMATSDDYQNALTECAAFNSKNTFRKRAVACTPLLYGAGYEVWFLMQQVASVAVAWGGGPVGGTPSGVGYVLVNQGGVEMGQGVQIGVHQACAKALNVPMGIVRIGKVSTDHSPNQQGTGASTGSDLNVPAVVEASNNLRLLLESMEDTVVYNEGMRRVRQQLYGFQEKWLTDTYDQTTKRFIDSKTDPTNPSASWMSIRSNFVDHPFTDGSMLHTNYYIYNYRSWAMPTDANGHLLVATQNWIMASVSNDEAAVSSWAKKVQLKEIDPSWIWGQVCTLAFLQRVPLFATGAAKPQADGNNFPQPRPSDAHNWFAYYTYACAWSQVEVDGVTGEIDVLRTEMFYDAGGSRNPAADIGQVEGAFVQGLGNVMTEEQEYDFNAGVAGQSVPAHPTGRLVQKSIMEYAIPAHRTTPRRMNVNLTWVAGPLKGSDKKPLNPVDTRPERVRGQPTDADPQNRYRAKTTGEPPFVLCVSVVSAARLAIQALRQSLVGVSSTEFVQLSTPITPKYVLQRVWGDKSIADYVENPPTPAALAARPPPEDKPTPKKIEPAAVVEEVAENDTVNGNQTEEFFCELSGSHTVVIHVASCNNLLDRDVFSGESDPFVEVFLPERRLFQTPAVSGNANPRWSVGKGSAQARINADKKDDFITFVVWDRDPFKRDNFLGQAKLSVRQCFDGKRTLDLTGRVDEQDAKFLKKSSAAGGAGTITVDIIHPGRSTP